ncbi:MAG: lysophospholipid acyltransferase family protein [Alphaproteobacteria bacterium]
MNTMHIRSGLFLVAFYLNIAVFCIAAVPIMVFPPRWGLPIMRAMALVSDWWLAMICELRVEIRGQENIPQGGAIVASKHQSAWETIAFLHLVPAPAMVLKRQLGWLPLFGWIAVRFGCLTIDRAGGASALRNMVRRARDSVAAGRQIVIFPEGTRGAPGAPPVYQRGIAALYVGLDVPCVPVALNSGLFWPRRTWHRTPGTIIVEFLPPIEPGLGARAFLHEMETRIEAATGRLLAEAGRAGIPKP